VRHEIRDEELVTRGVVTPPGREHFFEAIGRPRRPGEPARAPFPHPADVERRMGLNGT